MNDHEVRAVVLDALLRNLSMCSVTLVKMDNGHKTEMLDLQEVRSMLEAAANNLAMVLRVVE